MKNELIEKLDLPKELKEKINFKNAIYYEDGQFLELIFDSKKFLTPEEITAFIKSLKIIKDLDISLDNIIIEQEEKKELKPYHLYSYLYKLSKRYRPKLKTSNFYIEEIDGEFRVVCADQETFKNILQDFEKVKKILNNFNIFSKKLFLIQDGSKFKRKKLFETSIKENEEAIKESQNFTNKKASSKFVQINSGLNDDKNNVYFEGLVFKKEVIKTKNNAFILNCQLKNKNDVILCTFFTKSEDMINDMKENDYIRAYGNWSFNKYRRHYALSGKKFEKIDKNLVEATEKIENLTPRSELHIHSKMSSMDAVGSISEYYKRGQQIGLKAMGFVDHNSVQSYPEIHNIGLNYPDIKPIYGVEFDIFDDINTRIIENPRNEDLLDCDYVFFDLETTGISPLNNEIIEFGAVRWKDGQIVERKQLFIKPKKSIPQNITNITRITDEIVKDAPSVEEALPIIKEWIGDSVLVAHNANFDYSFLNYAFISNGIEEITNPIIDTLKISWFLNPTLKNHRLGTVARLEGQIYDEKISHRGDYDAQVLQKTYENMLHRLFEKGIRNLEDFNPHNKAITKKIFTNHITVLAKNSEGIKDIYKLISIAHIDYFNSKRGIPTLPLSLLEEYRKNLLFGSACKNGLVWEAINNQSKNLEIIFSYFDYIEIFTPSVFSSLIEEGKFSEEEIHYTILKIIETAKKLNKKVVLTNNVHYVEKSEKEIREIYILNKGLGGKLHPLYRSNFKKGSSPDQHLKNNDEILEELNKFIKDPKLIEEIVFRNPNKIVEMIDKNISPIKTELYPPIIEGATEKFLELINTNLYKTYGDNPHPEIITRFNKELESIQKNKYEIIYYLSSLAVKKSLEDGFLVGSRGSVGSSFIATMAEITEVNPLRPHYLCHNCKYHEFIEGVSSGYDIEDKKCPKCGEMMKGNGHWIPFETFLGFENAKKVPDIDLNFSRDYQATIHNYIKDLLGEERVFRAGTISTVAERTAYGYVKNWLEILKIEHEVSDIKINYLAKKAEGTKRTTGQHPGGLIVVPSNMDIYDFTPINFPGNDLKSNWKTTHFDFHSIHDNLLKLDFLGHLDPSSLKMLQELTEVDPKTIPMNDKKVLSLFLDNKALNYKTNYTNEKKLGILGMSEFGTNFVRELVKDTKPKTFSDLVRISGLSHGTDVWSGNAKKLIDSKTATLSEVISVRDDIMIYLIEKGIDDFKAFQIMESVRKGKGLKKEWEELMIKSGVPQWYIDSSKIIKYIFPKAHAIAYVMMAFRITWYKIYYPLEYYATFFTKRDTEWDIDTLMQGIEGALEFQKRIKTSKEKTSERDKSIYETYDVLLEMYSRGFKVSDISLEKSDSDRWIIDYENNSLIPPFSIIEGLGGAAAQKLIKAREEKSFKSYRDFEVRSGLNKTILAKFDSLGLTNSIKTDTEKDGGQILLFDQ